MTNKLAQAHHMPLLSHRVSENKAGVNSGLPVAPSVPDSALAGAAAVTGVQVVPTSTQSLKSHPLGFWLQLVSGIINGMSWPLG